MARKRANTKDKRANATVKISREATSPLMQNEVYLVKELVDQSNAFGKLQQQFQQYEFTLQDIIWKRKQVQKGEIKLPILLPFAGNALYSVNDKKKVLDDLDKQIKVLTNSRDGINGQMIQRRDEFIESGLRLHTFIASRFGGYTSKILDNGMMAKSGVRTPAGSAKAKKNEQVAFEAEFDDLIKDPKLREEFKSAAKKATDENKKLTKGK